MVSLRKGYLLLARAAVSGCIDAEVVAFVKKHHPQFLPVIQTIHSSHFINSTASKIWKIIRKEMQSLAREFIASTLAFIAVQPKWMMIMAASPYWNNLQDEPLHIMNVQESPWIIPTEKDIAAMSRLIGGHSVEATPGLPDRYWDKKKYRFSAASVTINFLHNIDPSVYGELRRLVLHEDHTAVAWSECHAKGLIPFCKTNANLRVERRVSLWRTILPAGEGALWLFGHHELPVLRANRYDRVRSDTISRGRDGNSVVAGWIMEAFRLPGLGMPENAFTLIIDGDLVQEKSTEIMGIVQHDAAWQTAFETCVDGSDNWLDARKNESYIMTGFPEAMQAINDNKSLVKFNFDIGRAHDVSRLVATGRGWSLEQWAEKWRLQHLVDLETEEPLPRWLELRREDYDE